MPVISLGQIQGFKDVIKTNSTTHTKDIDLLSQEKQDYYNWHDQQFIACNHDVGQEYYNWSDQQFMLEYKQQHY